MLRVAVTGASGQIAYALLYRIASGEVFGSDVPVALHLLELPHGIDALKGVVMELNDCASPIIQEIIIGSEPRDIFADVDYAILVGAKPRGAGMERKDLLASNGAIFAEQGAALNEAASKEAHVFVVGNPCNTNCLIAMHNAPNIPRNHFHAMTRLDQHRAAFQLAYRADCSVTEVSRVAIWGNHSATQVPDFCNARIGGRPAREVIGDDEWLTHGFIETVQKRGAEVIAARGKSSAASAAHAIVKSIQSVRTPSEEPFSSAIISDGNPYGVVGGIVFSFPCFVGGKGLSIASDFQLSDFLKQRIAVTEKELLEERDCVRDLLI